MTNPSARRAAKSKKHRRLAAKRLRKQQAANPGLLVPRVPLHHQTIDLPTSAPASASAAAPGAGGDAAASKKAKKAAKKRQSRADGAAATSGGGSSSTGPPPAAQQHGRQLADARHAAAARTQLSQSMRHARRAHIKEANFLKQMR